MSTDGKKLTRFLSKGLHILGDWMGDTHSNTIFFFLGGGGWKKNVPSWFPFERNWMEPEITFSLFAKVATSTLRRFAYISWQYTDFQLPDFWSQSSLHPITVPIVVLKENFLCHWDDDAKEEQKILLLREKTSSSSPLPLLLLPPTTSVWLYRAAPCTMRCLPKYSSFYCSREREEKTWSVCFCMLINSKTERERSPFFLPFSEDCWGGTLFGRQFLGRSTTRSM